MKRHLTVYITNMIAQGSASEQISIIFLCGFTIAINEISTLNVAQKVRNISIALLKIKIAKMSVGTTVHCEDSAAAITHGQNQESKRHLNSG